MSDARAVTVKQAARRYLDRSRELPKGRHLRIAFARLDSAHLGRVHPASRGYLLLGQPKPLAGVPQIGAKIAHSLDRRACRG